MQITISNLEIPIKIVKKNIVLAISSIKMLRFIRNLKLADITPLYKKGKKDIKGKVSTSKYTFKFIKNI